MSTRLGMALALLCAAALATAQPLAPAPIPPSAGLNAVPGARLPLELPLVDSAGRAVRLADYFKQRPVLLVLGYYRCEQLCGLVMQGLLGALHESGLPRSDAYIVRVSIDPEDTPDSARLQRAANLAFADMAASAVIGPRQFPARAPAPLQLAVLTGSRATTRRLADAVGFRYSSDTPATAQGATRAGARFAHPAAVLVITPDGRLSRTLPGVVFDPAELRLALVEASQGRIGTLSDRIALLCAHVDPRLGRHSAAVLFAVQVFGTLLAAALAALLVLLHRRTRQAQSATSP